MNNRLLAGASFVAVAAAGLWWTFQTEPASTAPAADEAGSALAEVLLPETLSANAQIGENIYLSQCADCHGVDSVGRAGIAPPLVHIIYEPSHHGDEAFQRAAALGVQQHHWSFGNMPAVEGLTRGDVAMVVDYIRELQQANGIN
ncbi:cytochrome c [Gymnodinialimonas sp. 57CJ19]|uniref:c-type cytochrome n=1 Tax=Gymnodinialimonas sp. 57CJ19 TaxID=3138498 RepID=UPI0031342897